MKIERHEGSYEPTQPWPNHAELACGENRLFGLSALVREEHPSYQEFYFSATIEIPEKVLVRESYYTGQGWRRPTTQYRGAGACGGPGNNESFTDALREAEQKAWNRYQETINCLHEFRPVTMSDQARTPLLNGDGSCSRCHLYIHNYFMDNRLFRAQQLATRAHDGQKRKYNNAPYIVHPRSVYDRVQWWGRKIPWDQRVRLGCAAWLHDVLEDCPEITEQEIIEAAGDDVLALVKELTNPSKKHPHLKRAERKKMDRDHLKTVSWEAKILKMFDRVENLKDMRGCEDGFASVYARESKLLLESLRDADEGIAKEMESWIETLSEFSEK